MGFFRKTIVVFVGIWLLGAPAPSAESAQETLDSILLEAGSVREFIAESENAAAIREKYFLALQSYYGGADRFPRKSFDAILGQLRTMNKSYPEIGARLWETTNLGEAFSIQTKIKTNGLEVKPKEFTDFLTDVKEKLSLQAKPFLEISAWDSRQMAETTAQKLKQEIERFADSVKEMPRQPKSLAMRDFYSKLSARADVKSLTAYLLLQHLQKEEVNDLLRANDADVIIDTWTKLRDGSSPLAENIPREISNLSTKLQLPDLPKPKLEVVDGAPAESSIFRVATRLGHRNTLYPVGRMSESEIEFKPIVRRFHGIWDGIALGECIGGSCDSLEALTPKRWAIPAMRKSQRIHVYKNKRYLGFVHLAPIKSGKNTFAAGDFGAPIFSNKVLVEENASLKPKTVFDLWLVEQEKRLPTSWMGIIVGESVLINNAKVLDTVHASSQYLLAKERIESAAVKSTDPTFEKAIARESKKADFGRGSSEGMVYEGGIKSPDGTYGKWDTKTFRVLNSKAELASSDYWDEISSQMKKAQTDPIALRDVLKIILKEKNWRPDVKVLFLSLFDAKDESITLELSKALLKEPEWPAEAWERLDTLLKKRTRAMQDVLFRLGSGSILHQPSGRLAREWPEAFWKKVPALINNSGQDVSDLLRQNLAEQPGVPDSAWKDALKLLRNESTSYFPFSLIDDSPVPLPMWFGEELEKFAIKNGYYASLLERKYKYSQYLKAKVTPLIPGYTENEACQVLFSRMK